VLTGVLTGVAIALGLSLVNFMRRAASPHDAVLGRRPDRPGWGDVLMGAEPEPGLLVYRFDAPLFFANAQVFRDRVLALVAASEPTPRWLLVRASAIGELDVTATDTLRRLFTDLDQQGITIAMSGAHAQLRRFISEPPALVAPGHLYTTIGEAVDAYRSATGPAFPTTG
jgi:sulfate permease, SulP family